MNQTCKPRLLSGAKADVYEDLSGAAEAAPFQNRFMRWLLEDCRSENVSGAGTVEARLAALGGADECVRVW